MLVFDFSARKAGWKMKTLPRAPRAASCCAPAARWLTWLLGGAIVAAVVVGALHVSEGRAFVRLAARARPWWLVVAFAVVSRPCG